MRAAGQIAVKRICGALHVTSAYAAQPGVYPVQLAISPEWVIKQIYRSESLSCGMA